MWFVWWQKWYYSKGNVEVANGNTYPPDLNELIGSKSNWLTADWMRG